MSRSAALIIGQLTLKIRYRSTASVSTQLDEGPVAEVLKDEFTHRQPQRDTVDIAAQPVNKVEERSARFFMYVAEKIAGDQSTHTHTMLLLNIFKHFASTYLATKDIHSLRPDIHFRHRYTQVLLCSRCSQSTRDQPSIPKQESALIASLSKKASIFALFGGQRNLL
jgi:fatty acid synthase subunit beta